MAALIDDFLLLMNEKTKSYVITCALDALVKLILFEHMDSPKCIQSSSHLLCVKLILTEYISCD